MFFIIIFLLFIISIWGDYKLCIYLNENSNIKAKKINNIVSKLYLSGLFIILIILLYNGIDGYLNGNTSFLCETVKIDDCFNYGITAFFERIFEKLYWSIPLIMIFLLYIIIYKVKYKEKIINNKFLYFILIIILTLTSFIPLYKPIINKLYFTFNDYNYELIIKNFDYNNYYIRVYNQKINVIKKEQIVCTTTPCNPIYNGEYEINFSNDSMTKIYNYINDLFDNKNANSMTIYYNNIKEENELNIVKAIITNDEIIIKS